MEKNKVSNYFLGPSAENSDFLKKNLKLIFTDYIYWRKNYCPGDKVDKNIDKEWFEKLNYELQKLLSTLKANYPFYSPRYMAHMLSETIIPGILGYFAGMLFNPNNVTDEAGPVTVNMEIEFGKKICLMLGYKKDNNNPSGWAHICSGGSIANLESLWFAREIQFIPLIVQEFCQRYEIKNFNIKTPNGKWAKINELSSKSLLSLKPNEKIYITSKLFSYLANEKIMTSDEAINKFNAHIKNSKFSVRWTGFINVISNIKLKPVIFVPETAHYSWDKTASILGYGNASIRRIPINSKFRINVQKLKEMLYNLGEDEFVVAVITVVGTTEEGAVDPIHKVQNLRIEYEKEKNLSFWLHIDSAWGGFIRSLFNSGDYQDIIKEFPNKESSELKEYNDKIRHLEEKYKIKKKIISDFERNKNHEAIKSLILMNVKEKYNDNNSFYTKNYLKKDVELRWEDLSVIKAFMSFNEADSITIDPHKLGYIQYPAGVIAFKSSSVTLFISQKASYISTVTNGLEKVYQEEVNSIGPYIIEGSKPGASAVACWLSEKTIPFNITSHGEIIKNTLLNAKRFSYFISKLNEENISNSFGRKIRNISKPYKIVRLYDNIDTNLICFFILPMIWKEDSKKCLADKDINLNLIKMNLLNENIYKHFTILNKDNNYIYPHSIKFFISRTRLTSEAYSYNSIHELLECNYIKQNEYEKEGLFVIRATLMNPWHFNPNTDNTDYYFEFFKELNETIINEINKAFK